MGYVPGYEHDIFISYAHGDDRSWINRLVDRLEPALKQRLGVKPDLWIDDDALRRSRDFSKEIPDSVQSSAVFLLLASPSYIRSAYCVQKECMVFEKTITAKRSRFTAAGFANDLFALRCLILPVDGNEHWSLFPGLTDIAFCDDSETFAAGSPEFETGFRQLVGELVALLKRMRNHSTSVFLYPAHPGADVLGAHTALASELSVQSYRLLPDRTVNVTEQLRDASMSVFLLGADFDDGAGELAQLAAEQADKPWVVWSSPAAEQTATADQSGFCAYLEQLDSPSKTYLNGAVTTAKLKEEVLGLLRPDPRVLPETHGKPRIYLVYNARDRAEVKNAGLISFHFRKEFHFEFPDDPAQHTLRLSRSDGVLLVWGNADEEWCSREFAEMVQSSRRAVGNGLCLFDPLQTKTEAVERIRERFQDIYIGEQYGKFDSGTSVDILHTDSEAIGGGAPVSFAAVLDRLQRFDSPYPGLRPFEVQESHLFFGRDLQIAELVARLERNRFLAVLGVSGSGKSSLVRAGLIPALERGCVTEAGRRWRIVVTRPAGAPFETLAANLEQRGLDPSHLRHSSHGLIEIAQQLPGDESLLVVVDQFEELFRYKDLEPASEEARRTHTSSATDAAEFVQLLLASSAHQPPVFIVITMRSDYLGDCAEFRDLPETLNDCQYLVPRLTREQRKEAIEGPLGRVDAAPSVVQRMLNDAGDEPDQLPVLQHALMRTWTRWHTADPTHTRRIELQDYESIGGFESALNQHADELVAGVPPELAAAIFKRLTARGRSNRERRDPATLRELWSVCGAETPARQAAVTAVVDHFRRGEATFLAPRDGEIGPDTYIDITHESLIRQWKKLRDEWVPEERRSAKTFLELAQRAAKWKAKEGELLAGLDLFDALAWERQRNRSAAWAEHYADAADLERVLEFIKASEVAERKRAFRNRTLWVAGPILMLFVALGVLALYQAWRAARLSRIALARQLTTQSQLLLAEQVDLEPALLLATDSLQRVDDLDSARGVREAAALLPRTMARLEHPAAVKAVAFTPDGRQVVTIGEDDIVRVLDPSRETKEVSRIAHENMAPLALSADGRVVALFDRDRGVVIADVASGKEVHHVPDAGGSQVALSPDGHYLSSDQDRNVGLAVFDTGTGQKLTDIEEHSPILSMAVSAGARVAIGTLYVPGVNRASVPLSDPATANSARVFQLPVATEISHLKHNGGVRGVALTLDGHYVATGSEDKTARVFDAENGNEIARLTHQGAVNAVAFSADGHWVATGSDDKTARVFEAATGMEVARLTHQDAVVAVAFSPDSRRVITGSKDKTARVIEATGGPELWRATLEQQPTAAAFSADGQRLMVGSGYVKATNVQVFEMSTRAQAFSLRPTEAEVRGVGMSADGRWVVVGGGRAGPTRVFKADDSAQPAVSIDAPSPAVAVGISDDGRRVATLGGDNIARIWDGTKEIAHLDEPATHAVALSADGRRIVVGGGSIDAGGTVKVFDLPEVGSARAPEQAPWTAVAQFTQPEPVLSVGISEDGRWVAAASGPQGWLAAASAPQSGITRMFEVGGKAAWVRRGESVNSIALSARVGMVATGGEDGFARVLELATGKEVLPRLAVGGAVVALRLVEEGRYLMAASRHEALQQRHDIVVLRQPLAAQELIAEACSRVTRNLTADEWAKYVGPEIPYRKTCRGRP